MTTFAANLVLAIIWAAALGSFTASHLFAGFVLGFGILALLGWQRGSNAYPRKVLHLIEFAAFFAWQLVTASARVAGDIITPAQRARPGIIAIPLDARSDAEITLLANLVSLTPGSVSLDVSADRRTLFVHFMFVDDPETCRREIKDGFERRVLELLR